MTDIEASADGEGTGDRESRWGSALERRRYLQLLGVASLLGSGTMAGTAAASESEDANGDDLVEVTDADEDEEGWEEAADERIQEYRTAPLAVEVINGEGETVSGAEITVEMREHEYGFGSAVNAPLLIEETEAGDEYREYIPELFNKAVLENHHKWRFFEENQDLSDAATEWLLEQGLAMRGHACLWANRDAYAVPADVEDALDDGDGEYVRERTLEHIEEIITHYGDDIEEWDVVNEAIHETSFIIAIDGSVNPVEAPILAEWYQTAQEAADEEGVSIAVNDYNVLTGPHPSTRSSYETQIEFLLEEGVDLGGIGLQSHFGTSSRLSPAEILEGLNQYAEYGVELRSTEFDTYQGNWDSSEEQAEFLHEFLKTFFSHPATGDFLMWGFWDGEHWGDDAPLFYENWEPKPAYDVYTGLVFEEWWTEEEGETDGDGTYETRGFKGEYELTASYGDESETITTTLADDSDPVEFTLDVEVDEESDAIPGFGVVSAAAGIAATVGYALTRRDSDD